MGRIGLLAGAALLALAACDRDVILPGERVDLRGEAATRNQGAVPISLPPQTASPEWTHKAARPDHDMPHAALAANPQLRFAAPIGQGEDRKHRITADPVVSDGRVFTVDSRARVMAHSTSGQPLWAVNAAPAGEPADAVSGAGLAVSGGTLYVSTAFGQLIALDVATGGRRWAQDLGAAASGAPTVSGNRVYVVASDATAWAIDTANGRVVWTEQGTPSGSGVTGGASPAISDNLIVLPFASRELRGVLPGGTGLWTSVVAGTRVGRVYASITDITGDPVIDGDTVYAGSPSGRINAYDVATGTQRWSAEDGAMSPVVVTGGAVFAVTDQAELVRLDAATGARVWGKALPFFQRSGIGRRQATFAHYGPVLAGGRLWVSSSDGQLRAFDPSSGALVGAVALPGGAATNAAVAGQTLYVVSTDGQLLAFR